MRIVVVISGGVAAVVFVSYLIYKKVSKRESSSGSGNWVTVFVSLGTVAATASLGAASYAGELGADEASNRIVAYICWAAAAISLVILLQLLTTTKASIVDFLTRIVIFSTAIACFTVKSFSNDLDTVTGLVIVLIFMLMGTIVIAGGLLTAVADKIEAKAITAVQQTRRLTEVLRHATGDNDEAQQLQPITYNEGTGKEMMAAHFWCRMCALVYVEPSFASGMRSGALRVAEKLKEDLQHYYKPQPVKVNYFCQESERKFEHCQGRFAVAGVLKQENGIEKVANLCVVLRGTESESDVLTDLTTNPKPLLATFPSGKGGNNLAGEQAWRAWTDALPPDNDETTVAIGGAYSSNRTTNGTESTTITPYHVKPPFDGIQCALGFRQRAMAIAYALHSIVHESCGGKKVRLAPDVRIDIAGHSLGGAVGTLLALFFTGLIKKWQPKIPTSTTRVRLYTYGQPRVIGAPIATDQKPTDNVFKLARNRSTTNLQKFDKLLYIVRVKNISDPVPEVPPQNELLLRACFWHFSNKCVELDMTTQLSSQECRPEEENPFLTRKSYMVRNPTDKLNPYKAKISLDKIMGIVDKAVNSRQHSIGSDYFTNVFFPLRCCLCCHSVLDDDSDSYENRLRFYLYQETGKSRSEIDNHMIAYNLQEYFSNFTLPSTSKCVTKDLFNIL